MTDQLAQALIAVGSRQKSTAKRISDFERSETHGIFTQQQTVSGVYAATVFDGTIFTDTSGGVVTVNLPTAVNLSGRIYTITDTGNAAANNVTVNASGLETINGSASATLSVNNQSIMVQSDGSNWFIIAGYP